MKWLEAIQVALRVLAANKLRSLLTMSGIVIGISAVIALMSIGRGVEQYVAARFLNLGSNLLFVVPGQTGESALLDKPKPLTLADAEAIADVAAAPDVAAVAAEYTAFGALARGPEDASATVSGVTPNYAKVRAWQLTDGDFFSQRDYDERARVAVLGSKTYADLFAPGEYPVGQTVRINNMAFTVIGVLAERGGGAAGNQDETVLIPLSTLQDRLFRRRTVGGQYEVSVIYALVPDEDSMPAAQTEIEELLRTRRSSSYLAGDDFSVVNQADVVSTFGNILAALTVFLSAIAGISLLVGGIGIMNIMLVSTTERTREIGLRKAVGARRADLLFQFLVEAVTLSVTAGAIGVTVGVVGARAISLAIDDFHALVGADVIGVALGLSLAIGLFFGIYPAWRASRLNPVEALRYE